MEIALEDKISKLEDNNEELIQKIITQGGK